MHTCSGERRVTPLYDVVMVVVCQAHWIGAGTNSGPGIERAKVPEEESGDDCDFYRRTAEKTSGNR